MNRPLVHRMGANLPWRKILKLLLIQRVVCTALWYKPLSHLYHGIKIGGAKIASYEFSDVPAFFDVSGLQPAA